MKYSILLLVLIALLMNVRQPRAAEIAERTLSYEGNTRTFFEYAPASSTSSASLLLLLHGSGGNGFRMAELWKEFADREGIVLVAPNAWRRDAWRLKEDGPDFLHTVVQSAEATHSVDGRRMYLFGQSGGAVYALIMAMLESRYFAAAAVHAGAWREAAEFRAMVLAQRKVPLKIIVGDRDEFFPTSAVHQTEEALKRAGFPIDVEIVEGQHHAYVPDVAAAINESAWGFLTAHALSDPPVFTIYQR
jgi:poly(3-hydroxybutyrate) depolymerase